MGCWAGVPPVSDIAVSPCVGQAFWGDAVAVPGGRLPRVRSSGSRLAPVRTRHPSFPPAVGPKPSRELLAAASQQDPPGSLLFKFKWIPAICVLRAGRAPALTTGFAWLGECGACFTRRRRQWGQWEGGPRMHVVTAAATTATDGPLSWPWGPHLCPRSLHNPVTA